MGWVDEPEEFLGSHHWIFLGNKFSFRHGLIVGLKSCHQLIYFENLLISAFLLLGCDLSHFSKKLKRGGIQMIQKILQTINHQGNASYYNYNLITTMDTTNKAETKQRLTVPCWWAADYRNVHRDFDKFIENWFKGCV